VVSTVNYEIRYSSLFFKMQTKFSSALGMKTLITTLIITFYSYSFFSFTNRTLFVKFKLIFKIVKAIEIIILEKHI